MAGGPIGTKPQETWIWDPEFPNRVTTIPVPNLPSGEEDIFCGGHTFRRDSAGDTRLVSVGGTDMVEWVATPPGTHILGVGTNKVFEFHNDTSTWSRLVNQELNEERFYGSALRDFDGRVVAFGNSGVLSHLGGATLADESREVLTPGTGWTKLLNEELLSGDCQPAIPTPYPITTTNYPDVHLLSTGHWIRVDSPPTYFYERNSCPASTDPDRFIFSTGDAPLPQAVGHSVHLLPFDQDVLTRSDVVYAIGGATAGGCAQGIFSKAVVKMEDPVIGKAWTSAPDMAVKRNDGFAVVLLDGSILMIGGANYSLGAGTCIPTHAVERFEPPEIFETPLTSWDPMASLLHPRTYHCVAVLLPNGSVVIAGGVGTHDPPSAPQPSWWSIEVYRPPYFFQPQQRPEIVLGPLQSGPYTLGADSIFFTALNMNELEGEFRVALIAPGSGTHSVDFNQRYIELDLQTFLVSGGDVDLTVAAPESGNVAPPGWYMLTVVNKDGIPSVAKWVELIP